MAPKRVGEERREKREDRYKHDQDDRVEGRKGIEASQVHDDKKKTEERIEERRERREARREKKEERRYPKRGRQRSPNEAARGRSGTKSLPKRASQESLRVSWGSLCVT